MGIIYLNPHMETGNNHKYTFPYGDFCITRFYVGIIYLNPHIETGKYVCQSPYGNCFHMATHMETDSRPFPYGDLCFHMGITYMVIFKNTAHSPVIHLLLKCIILEYDTHNIQVNGSLLLVSITIEHKQFNTYFPHPHIITHYSSCVFLQHLLFLWQRDEHSLPAFLHEQLIVRQLPLQLQCTIPCPPTDDTY